MPTPTFITHAATLQTPRPTLSPSSRSRCPRHPAPIRACDAPPSAPPSTPTPEQLEQSFTRLKHINKNLRIKASATIAEVGGTENIARLCDLLHLSDTDHRRAAVKTLGMIGMDAVPRVATLLRESEDPTVRASCSKVLAAVALFFPDVRERFPDGVLDGLREALETDPDPVTKIATVGCLGTLGSDVKERDGGVVPGCERAVTILMDVSGSTQDVALGAVVVGALAQIGQNGGVERKEQIVRQLEALKSCSGEEGFNYVQEMAASHMEQLEGNA